MMLLLRQIISNIGIKKIIGIITQDRDNNQVNLSSCSTNVISRAKSPFGVVALDYVELYNYKPT